MLVFRTDRRRGCAGELLQPLCAALRDRTQDGKLAALIFAGMLEAALSDAGCPGAADAAGVADALAHGLPASAAAPMDLEQWLERVPASQEISYSAPEGFAYYDVHPLQYAAAVRAFPRFVRQASYAVIGIRSIGTTLGAAIAAGCSQVGVDVQRISVRPGGHPYDRRTRFSPQETEWVQGRRQADAAFIVADEGPGRSGSSFLSVGDALIEQGVPRHRILFVCSAEPDVARLCAPDAARRWRNFASCVIPPRHRSWESGVQDWSAGEWRRKVFDRSGRPWPSCWIQFERKKFADEQRGTLIKFEGLGSFGQAVFDRARTLADGRFSAPVHWIGDGYLQYDLLRGKIGQAPALCREVLDRMADYLCFRIRAFSQPDVNLRDIEEMVSTNLAEEVGQSVGSGPLPVERPVLADGRMQPHEWISTASGWMKVDAVAHGDDHFFPGPADIAWDLAGAIIEWEMAAPARNYLLGRYRRLTGDDPRARLGAWLLAYATFRTSHCRMAAEAMSGTAEAARLRSSYHFYRAAVLRLWRTQVAA
jgi:hypothetical protein